MVPRNRLIEEANGLAQHLATLDQRAIAALKEALRHGPDLPLDQALEMEARLVLKLVSGKGRDQAL